MKASFHNDDSKKQHQQSLPPALNDNHSLTLPTNETALETTGAFLETTPSPLRVTPTTPTPTPTPSQQQQQPSAAVALAEEIKLKFLENQTLATPRNGRKSNNNINNSSSNKHQQQKTPFYSPASTSSSFQEELISNDNDNGNAAYALEEGFLTAPLPMGVKPSTTFALQLATASHDETTSRMGSTKSRPTATGTGTGTGQPKKEQGYNKKYSRWNYAQKYDLKNVGLGLGALRQQTSSIPSRRSSTNVNVNGTSIGNNGIGNGVVYSRQATSMQGNGNSNGESQSTATNDDGTMGPIEDVEWTIRNRRTNSCWNFLRSSTAALLVFLVYLITLETILSCALTTGLTLYWFHQYQDGGSSSITWNGSGLDWVVLGFAVVTPITVTITLAFRRREFALYEIRRVRTCAFQIYLSHAIWNWDDATGRDKAASKDGMDWLDHTDTVLHHLIAIGDELCRFLTLPTSSRSSHRMLKSGRREAAEIVQVAYRLFESLYTQRIIQLSYLTEQLKQYGLSTSEASRIRQYERYVGEAVEGLRAYKMYRTPQALRAFGRIFTVILPPFYAPTFAQLAFDLHSLSMGILFAVITPLCLTALYESTQAIEDPFVGFITLDGIDVKEEFEVLHWHQMMNARNTIFPHAPTFEKTSLEAIDSYRHMVQDENHIFAMDASKSFRNGGSSSRGSFKGGGAVVGGGHNRMDSSSRVSHFAAELLGGGTEHKSLRSRSERNLST